MNRLDDLSIAIPTYGRTHVMLDTVERLLALPTRAHEILLVDQNPRLPPDVERKLGIFEGTGLLRRLRHSPPGIPAAMNAALRSVRTRFILFLDDDIEPLGDLAAEHRAVLEHAPGCAGMVLQPGEEPVAAWDGPVPPPEPVRAHTLASRFLFCSQRALPLCNCMAGNLSLDRARALAVDGFDEEFSGCAYRFESEFAHRFCRRAGPLWYEPRAAIRHLRAPSGGTREVGDSASNACNDYRYALKVGPAHHAALYILRRLLQRTLGAESGRGLATIRRRLAEEWGALQAARERT